MGGALVGWQRELAAPVVTEFRDDTTNRFVPSTVAFGSVQNRGDVLDCGIDTEMIREQFAEAEAVRITLVLGHEDPEHFAWSQRLDRQCGAYRAVNAAAESDDVSLSLEIVGEVSPQRFRDSFDCGGRIDC